MTVLSALLGRPPRSGLENPAVPLTDGALVDWLGGGRTLAGVNVSEERVFGLTAYYRGIALLAGTMAGLPLKVYRVGTREAVRQKTVLANPNPRQTPFEFWQTTYANAIGWGNGFARKLRDGADIVRQVWPLHPSRVRVEEVDPSDANPAGKLFLVLDRHGVEQRFTSDEIMHIPYLSTDGVKGVRPLKLFRQNFGIAVAAEETAARFYGSGAKLDGILSTAESLTEPQATRLKRRWKEKVSGPGNAGEIAVLDKGAKFERVAIPPQDAELLTTRKFSVTEIARMLGLPPHLLADVEKSTSWGTGIEQQNIGLVVYTVKHWLDLVEQRVTRELLPGGWDGGDWYAEYSLEGLLRGDSKARADFYARLVQIGAMSPAQVRSLENWEPVDGLDFYLVPKNMEIVRPGAPDQEGSVLDITRALQQVYLAVGKVITQEEARAIVNRLGADLGDAPDSSDQQTD